MPREQGAGPNDASDTGRTGGSDEAGERGDTGRMTDWQRIDAEKPQRDALSRKWDAEHDPSPEFENAARPLPPDHGSHRPKHLDLTPDQIADIEEFTGRPISEVLAARDRDPRAGHNRDEQGRILDQDGNPRELAGPDRSIPSSQTESERSTENDSERSADQRPEAEDSPLDEDDPARDERDDPDPAADLEAPSDSTDEADEDESGDQASVEPETAGADGDGGGIADQDSPEDLRDLGRIATDLRAGRLTPEQAAEQLEAFRDLRPRPAATEGTTETVRTEQTEDGERHFQRGTPEGIDDQPGDRTANDESDQVSDRERRGNKLVDGAANMLGDSRKMMNHAQDAITQRLPPGSRGETTVRQPDVPTIETRQPDKLDAGNVLAGTLATVIAAIVIRRKISEHLAAGRRKD